MCLLLRLHPSACGQFWSPQGMKNWPALQGPKNEFVSKIQKHGRTTGWAEMIELPNEFSQKVSAETVSSAKAQTFQNEFSSLLQTEKLFTILPVFFFVWWYIMFFTTNNVEQNVEASWLHEASLGQLEKRGSLHEWHLSPASRKTLTTFRFSSSFFHCSTQSSIRNRPCAHEDDAENEERQLTSLAPDDDRPHGSNAGTAGAADDQKHRNDRRGRNARKRPETKPKAPQWVWRDGTRWKWMEHGQMGWFWFEVAYYIYLYKRILSYII